MSRPPSRRLTGEEAQEGQVPDTARARGGESYVSVIDLKVVAQLAEGSARKSRAHVKEDPCGGGAVLSGSGRHKTCDSGKSSLQGAR